MTAADEARDGLVAALGDAVDAVSRLETYADRSMVLDPQGQADAIALVIDLRQRLGTVETDMATTLGKGEGPIQGNLSDGRQFTLKRSAERKAWNHDDWKRDVRRAIVKRITEDQVGWDNAAEVPILHPETGEILDGLTLATALQIALTEAQEVHGSTDPRTTALRRLGLYATDYCESRPGGWRFATIKPTPPTPDTTTPKD